MHSKNTSKNVSASILSAPAENINWRSFSSHDFHSAPHSVFDNKHKRKWRENIHTYTRWRKSLWHDQGLQIVFWNDNDYVLDHDAIINCLIMIEVVMFMQINTISCWLSCYRFYLKFILFIYVYYLINFPLRYSTKLSNI